mgnify:CR=1 FL=1
MTQNLEEIDGYKCLIYETYGKVKKPFAEVDFEWLLNEVKLLN